MGLRNHDEWNIGANLWEEWSFFTTGNGGMAVCFAGALGGFFTLMILPAHLIEPCVELSIFLCGVYSLFSIYGGKGTVRESRRKTH